MNKRRVILLSTCAILSSMFLVGCSEDSSNSKNDANSVENTMTDNTNEVEKPAKKPSDSELEKLEKEKEAEIESMEKLEAETKQVGIWIPNIEYVSTGDESLEKLVRVEVDSILESEESDKYLRMLKTLNKSGDSAIQVIEFLGTKLNGDVLEIDMADATELGISSTTTEFLLIEQIKATIFENFEEVKSIQFKVDGKIVESFLGHVDISKPFER